MKSWKYFSLPSIHKPVAGTLCHICTICWKTLKQLKLNSRISLFNKLCYRQLLLSMYVSCHSWNVVWIVKNGVIDAHNNQKLYAYKVNIEHKTFVKVLNTRKNEHARNCWRIVHAFRTCKRRERRKSFNKMSFKRCQMDAVKFTYSQFTYRNIFVHRYKCARNEMVGFCMLCT